MGDAIAWLNLYGDHLATRDMAIHENPHDVSLSTADRVRMKQWVGDPHLNK